MRKEITVLIADDHPIFRQGLAAIIEKSDNLRLVGEADNGWAAIELIGTTDPDVVILDIDMPIMDGIEAARALKERSSRAILIFLTMHKDNSILRSIKSLGVKGYVLKDSALDEIVRCIHTVMSGKLYLSPALNELILDNVSDDTDSNAVWALGSLSQTEKKVLLLISDSKTNREIAADLFVAIRTVETHRYNICSKLDINGANALLKFAIRNKAKIESLFSN
ncbi:MAG TPA: response regulator transcription factor [Pyrinomonadaceae bacterium]|nr:response regulator transcription factor [Acidobacteriota bacterium]HQZ98116.1 response regulator transcription factor [Pyrinomonadaceae bacterium]